MFFKHIGFIAIVTTGTLLSACGGDGTTQDKQMKLTDQNQVKVFKYNQSIQCEGAGISLDEMRLELAKEGIDVICAQKAHDGWTRTAVCGSATGNINAYVIHSSNLPDAEKLGFKSVQELPEYKDQVCTN